MTNKNSNGQNGVATSANVNVAVVDFSNVSLTNTLVENFAKEITENLSRINSKGGCPLANFTINAKGGKVTPLGEGVEKLSVTWYMLTPYAYGNKKHRHEIIIENGIVRAGSVRNLLIGVLNYMSDVQEYFNDIKKYGVESSCVDIDFEIYPLLKSTYEKYGVAEMDRRFAEFSEYLASLDMDSSVAVMEQEISNAPCLVDNVYYVNTEYDIDRGIERVADTIEKYLLNYTSSYLDQFGDCVITVYWDYFSENDMKMLIENSIFALAVRDTLYERGVIENLDDFLVYDDGVYVTVDYDKIFNKGNVLNILRRECALCEVDEYEMTINALADMCGGYYVNAPIHVMYDKESDSYYVNGLGEDNDYAINEKLTSKTSYMELYDMITELLENVDNEFNNVA